MNIERYRTFLCEELLNRFDGSCSLFNDKYHTPIEIESKIYENFGNQDIKKEIEIIEKELNTSQLNFILQPEEIVNIMNLEEESNETGDSLFYENMDGEEADEFNNSIDKRPINELYESYLNNKKKDESLMHFLQYNYDPIDKKTFLSYLSILNKECCDLFDYYIEDPETFCYLTINNFISSFVPILIDFIGNYNNVTSHIYLLMSNKLFNTNICFTNFGWACNFFKTVIEDNFLNVYDIDSPQLNWDYELLKKLDNIIY